MKFQDAKIFIAILDYPYIESECVVSTLSLYEYSKWLCGNNKYPQNVVELCFACGTSPARAHNKAITDFLDDPRGFKHLLIIGRDHIFKCDALQTLFEADKDIIAGITTGRLRAMSQLREPVWSIVSDWKDGVPVTLDRVQCLEKIKKEKYQPFEVSAIGDGLMLIKRKVFEKLPSPWFYEPPIPHEQRVNFKGSTGGTIGCDIIFCREAQKHGFKIWAHPGVQYVHIGRSYSAVEYKAD